MKVKGGGCKAKLSGAINLLQRRSGKPTQGGIINMAGRFSRSSAHYRRFQGVIE
jgi:hypothetical protein